MTGDRGRLYIGVEKIGRAILMEEGEGEGRKVAPVSNFSREQPKG
jgi:hypothetical protein